MAVLSKVRYLAFLVLLTAAMASSSPVAADEFCDSYGPCASCDTPAGNCYLWEGGECSRYPECHQVGWCQYSGGTVFICNCGECRLD